MLAVGETWAAPARLFDSPEQSADDVRYQRSYAPRWQRVLAEEAREPAFSSMERRVSSVDAKQWRHLVNKASTCGELDTLRMVNGYFNQWRSKQDAAAWETPEYWASPAEFIKLRGGDCEDYAIAKYFALRFLGFAPERMRVVVIRQMIRQPSGKGEPSAQLHAVLAVSTDKTWFILDNNARPRQAIVPHTQYQGRFVPLYSMNETGAWRHRPDPLESRPTLPPDGLDPGGAARR